MTIEEKAKAYDEALERVKNFIENGDEGEKTIAESIFAGLIDYESEDERIREEIIQFLRDYHFDKLQNKVSVDTLELWGAWLKKQKEQKMSTEETELNSIAFLEELGYTCIPPHSLAGCVDDKMVLKKLEASAKEYYKRNYEGGNPQGKGVVIQSYIDGASEWLRKHVCNYVNSEYNEFHKCVEYDGSIDKERLINDFEEAMQKEQKPIKMEVYKVDEVTTICGQDYKCKKDYKEGNCWYIKDVIYHCSRDGYLNDQNGVSWSCTPEWFNEYIYSNKEWAEEEKTCFVSRQFLQCKLSFDGFKEGEHYWLEYVGDDTYIGRSDNILNQKFHITPRQLFTLFSQELEEVQGPSQEKKEVLLNYEPLFDENPSDKEIIEALIKYLKEQDGFLTAINCVSTKAILSWLKKQKENPKSAISIPADCASNANGIASVKPAEWSKEYKEMRIKTLHFLSTRCSVNDYEEIEEWLNSLRPQPHWKPSKEQMNALDEAKIQMSLIGCYGLCPLLQSLINDLKKL